MPQLAINGEERNIETVDELEDAIASTISEQYLDLWLYHGTPALCVLVNGPYGWLMFLREEGDAGFSSRNPEFLGSDAEMIQYYLSNGQLDEYPASWALPREKCLNALREFLRTGRRPTGITWYDETNLRLDGA